MVHLIRVITLSFSEPNIKVTKSYLSYIKVSIILTFFLQVVIKIQYFKYII